MSRIVTGDAFDVLAGMDAESVHAVVTDPPYGLAFMGRDWDDFEPKEYQAWCEEWAALCLGVLKPGGHLLAFSGNRTHHRLFSGVEDAGFEVRDTLTWHYGSGFPKALDVSKAIDKAAGVEPDRTEPSQQSGMWSDDSEWNDCYNHHIYDEPATDAAREWDGWKTALKPATEFVVCARKPFNGTVAENVQAHGTGALNIDGCRVSTDDNLDRPNSGQIGDGTKYSEAPNPDMDIVGHDEGRYPANVIFDTEAAAALDREVGPRESDGIDFSETEDDQQRDKYGEYSGERTKSYIYDDTHDGPSRYFYTSKATRAERTLDGRIDNAHPTVKPIDLMEWLVRLVTAEGQTALDPFTGTGTTCRAAKNLGRDFIGIERQAKWADVARVRCGLTPDDPSHVRSDDAQRGIDAFAP